MSPSKTELKANVVTKMAVLADGLDPAHSFFIKPFLGIFVDVTYGLLKSVLKTAQNEEAKANIVKATDALKAGIDLIVSQATEKE